MGRAMGHKITLKLEDGTVRTGKLPYPNADHAVITGDCPHCKPTDRNDGFKVAGIKGTMAHDYDTYRARGGCLVCGAYVGELRMKVDTIFGIEEDERVFNMGIRVY